MSDVSGYLIVSAKSSCCDITCESVPGSPPPFLFLLGRGESLGTRLPPLCKLHVCHLLMYMFAVTSQYVYSLSKNYSHTQAQGYRSHSGILSDNPNYKHSTLTQFWRVGCPPKRPPPLGWHSDPRLRVLVWDFPPKHTPRVRVT